MRLRYNSKLLIFFTLILLQHCILFCEGFNQNYVVNFENCTIYGPGFISPVLIDDKNKKQLFEIDDDDTGLVFTKRLNIQELFNWRKFESCFRKMTLEMDQDTR